LKDVREQLPVFGGQLVGVRAVVHFASVAADARLREARFLSQSNAIT
jgi:hypothetical protein